MDGSITEISVSNQLLTWDEAFNYTAQRSILNADMIKHGETLLNYTYISKTKLTELIKK